MSRAEKKAARKAAQEQEAKTPRQEFATADEANTALRETAKVLNMKDREAKTAKGKKAAPFGALPPIPRAAGAHKEKPTRPCECGCGGTTKSRFVPGHDSYMRGLILRVQRDIMTLKDVEELVGASQRAAVEAAIKKIKAEGRKAERGAEAAEA